MSDFSADTVENVLNGRINLDPENVERSLVKLVLMVVETIRQLVERQAIRRVEGGTLNDEEIERLGLALLRLEQKMAELRLHFGLDGEDLSLRLRIPFDEL